MNHAVAASDVTAAAAPARPVVCWIVTNIIHYHDARMRAVQAHGRLDPHLVGLSDRDAFKALENRAASAPYARHTLFPDTPLTAVGGPELVRRLHAQLDTIRPSAVCINGWSAGGAGAALSWCLDRGVPAIMMSASTAFDARRHAALEWVKQRLVGLCAAGLGGGSPQCDYLRDLGMPAERVFPGYDVIDNDHFALGADAARADATALRQRMGLPERYFFTANRMIPKKNLSRLLDAYALYRRRATGTPWSLVLAGDGPLRGEIEGKVAALGLADSVIFPGFIGYADLPTWYGLSSAFVHVSTVEQWGLVVNEAMAAGLPVLVSDRCGCARDLVRPGVNGHSFDPEDTEAIARALSETAAPDADAAGQGAASRHIINQHSPRTFAENLEKAVAVAMSVPPPRPTMIDRAVLSLVERR